MPRIILSGYVDFNTRHSNLTDPGFVELLELVGRVFADLDWGPVPLGQSTFDSAGRLRTAHAHLKVFHQLNTCAIVNLNTFNAFFTAYEPIFKHYIPVVDDSGRLLLDSPGLGDVWAGVFITTASDGTLAWELTQHIIYAYTNPIGRSAIK